MLVLTGWDFRRRWDTKGGRHGLGDGWAEKAQAPVQRRSFLYIIQVQCARGAMPRVAQLRLGRPAVGCHRPPGLFRVLRWGHNRKARCLHCLLAVMSRTIPPPWCVHLSRPFFFGLKPRSWM